VDGVDEAAQLELYIAADRQPMQLDQGRLHTPISAPTGMIFGLTQ